MTDYITMYEEYLLRVKNASANTDDRITENSHERT